VISVHHLNNSRSQRILWLLEELAVPYEIRRYQRDPDTMLAPPALLAVHPLGKSPVITDGDITVAESGAIVEYLVEKFGPERLRPPRGSPEDRRYTYWLHYAEGSAMPPLLLKLVFDRVASTPVPWPVSIVTRGIARKVTESFIAPQLTRHFDFMEAELATRPWFAGAQFTAADIQMSFPLEAAAQRTNLIAARPHLRAFIDRIHARDAYRRALERGGPYAYA
jgi:glutathione S-transferase